MYRLILDFFNKEGTNEVDMTYGDLAGVSWENNKTHLTRDHPEMVLALTKDGKADVKSGLLWTFTAGNI